MKITYSQLKEHSSEISCWILIHNKVYDITKFMEEHPGGKDVLLSHTNMDASQQFDEVQHTMGAKEIMNKYYIGDISGSNQNSSKLTWIILSFLILILSVYFYKMNIQKKQ